MEIGAVGSTDAGSEPGRGRVDPGVVEPAVLWLDDERAGDVERVGAKAANLAISKRAGLPVLDGFAVTTHATGTIAGGVHAESHVDAALHDAWRRLSADGARPLVVRSSSASEDTATSSMAGRFTSVLHVSGWDAFVEALREVIRSAASVGDGDAPIAVLVQPMAAARVGGVLFGVNPLTGSRTDLLVSVVEGLPDQIVNGSVTGTQLVLGRRGSIRSVSGPLPAVLRARERRALSRLARATERALGGPQDVEWLIEPAGELRLLQSRPITAAALPPERSHPLGPGPVAETFPGVLRPLERDLWEPPLEDGIREALRISGAVGKKALAGRFVVDVGGRVAVDLEALGVVEPRHSLVRRLDPRPPARRLRAAWRIGRLRGALPGIAHDLVADVDGHLRAVPAPEELGDVQLLSVLANSRPTLSALHAYEVLSGFLLDQRVVGTTAGSVALATIAHARADGLSDDEIVARHPVVLSLLPPQIGGDRALPSVTGTPRTPSGEDDDPRAVARESLRLRVRFVHELTAVVAEQIGQRLARRGLLREATDVADLSLAEARALLLGLDRAGLPRDLPVAPPLPARFRLASDGSVVPELVPDGATVGVSPGRVEGVVSHDRAAADGTVLVVPTLDPALASVLPTVAAIVSETGSPLSHLAILAREYGIPAVVGFGDGVFRDGQRVLVDGTAGTVVAIDEVTAESPV